LMICFFLGCSSIDHLRGMSYPTLHSRIESISWAVGRP